MTTPLIRSVRQAYPKAQIDMVVRSDFLDLIAHNPHLDHKIGLERDSGIQGLLKLRNRIQSTRYDLIFDAHRSLRTLLLMPTLKSLHKAHLRKHYLKRSLALTLKLPLLADMPRMLERSVLPLAQYGIIWDGLGPEVFVDPHEKQQALTRWPKEKGPYLALIPSAQWPGKRWPPESFRQLLITILEKTSYHVCVFGGKSDYFCESICHNLPPERVSNLQGQLSLGGAMAMLSLCEVSIANDTGLMHVADALGIPNVLILGPTSKELGCLPFHPLSQIVEKSLWCRPCSKNGQAPCIRSQRFCLNEISPELVFSHLCRVKEALG